VKKIFVGNLDFSATEDSIRSLFEQHGTVERVSLMTDVIRADREVFAFVEMTDTGEAERAIAALNGVNLGGRNLNVNEARPKVEGGRTWRWRWWELPGRPWRRGVAAAVHASAVSPVGKVAPQRLGGLKLHQAAESPR